MNTCTYFHAQTHSPTRQGEFHKASCVKLHDVKPHVPSVRSSFGGRDGWEMGELGVHRHQAKNSEMHYMGTLNYKYRKELKDGGRGKRTHFSTADMDIQEDFYTTS